jgi:asparagine synthase (glutamine-hydrolysing)
MCGISGVVQFLGGKETLSAIVSGMVNQLVHRGPDAGAVWVDAAEGVGLGHRRLSILELSEAGAQPMHSASQRYVLAFNGEIYNHLELRRELTDYNWRGQSDTETLLAAIEQWGLRPALGRLVGMFAIALWDRERHELILARDRVGEKPLYYGWCGGVFLFGSELKALSSFPGWQGEVDRDSLVLYLRRSYVPAPRTIWKGVYKLLPGSYLTIPRQADAALIPRPVNYWHAASFASLQVDEGLDDAAAIQKLDTCLHHVIAGQMIADVPLGAFLSGGVDSSTIVAIMQAQSARPVNTFTIGFGEADYDEAQHARAVAEHIGTNHTELYCGPSDVLAVIPRLADIYDEPFGDSSQLPTFLVASMARKHVTVCLSGDAGDELFGGYNRYVWGPKIWHQIEHLPRELRRFAGEAITIFPSHFYNWIAHLLPHVWRQQTFGDQLHKLAGILGAANTDEIYLRLISQIQDPTALVIGGSEPIIWADTEAASFAETPKEFRFSEQMMFRDLVGYLPDDILTKVDRAAMAASLETRIPFLDYRLLQFAWSLPLNMKIRNGKGKWLLRQVLYRYVPKELIERPKQGFGVPIENWLRGPLREWAESLLDETRLRREGFLNPGPIRRKWQEHLSGHRNSQHWLWNVLMFQAWRERWL